MVNKQNRDALSETPKGGEPLFVERERESNTPISIIIPVYNVATYLAECLDSVLGQTYPHLEIIVVDDGSTDGSGAIADEYAERDARIKVVHKANGGLSSARNAGLEVMTGELVAFVDSDDWIVPDMVERCVAKFAQYPDLGIVRFAFEEYYDDGTKYIVSSIPVGEDTLVAYDDTFAYWAKGDLAHSVWSAVYKSSLIRHIRFLDGVYAEDLHFTMLLFREHPHTTIFIPDALYKYRVNATSISNSKYRAMMTDAFRFWDEGIRLMRPISTKKAGQMAYALFHHMRVLENKHRYKRTSGAELHELQDLFSTAYQIIKRNPIDWSLSPSPIRHFVYWHFPRLWRLLRPSDWGVESIRK